MEILTRSVTTVVILFKVYALPLFDISISGFVAFQVTSVAPLATADFEMTYSDKEKTFLWDLKIKGNVVF